MQLFARTQPLPWHSMHDYQESSQPISATGFFKSARALSTRLQLGEADIAAAPHGSGVNSTCLAHRQNIVVAGIGAAHS
jgi:hypothetical protein